MNTSHVFKVIFKREIIFQFLNFIVNGFYTYYLRL